MAVSTPSISVIGYAICIAAFLLMIVAVFVLALSQSGNIADGVLFTVADLLLCGGSALVWIGERGMSRATLILVFTSAIAFVLLTGFGMVYTVDIGSNSDTLASIVFIFGSIVPMVFGFVFFDKWLKRRLAP